MDSGRSKTVDTCASDRSKTVDDAMLLAVGSYLPEGILLGDAETEEEMGGAEHYPVYITEDPLIGGHIALFLELNTQRPDIGSERKS